MILKNFIVFEGIDGAGTSTQLNILKEKLQNKNVFFTVEPTDLQTGKFLRTILSGSVKVAPSTVAFLFDQTETNIFTEKMESLNKLKKAIFAFAIDTFFQVLPINQMNVEWNFQKN